MTVETSCIWFQVWNASPGYHFDVLRMDAAGDDDFDERPLVVQIDSRLSPDEASALLREIADDLERYGYRPSAGREWSFTS